MPAYPETVALAEQALGYVLGEQKKLLLGDKALALNEIIAMLSELALKTHEAIRTGFKKDGVVERLLTASQRIEERADEISEEQWMFINLSVSAIYEKMKDSMERVRGGSIAKDIRDQYNNLRIRLLEQALGARMLILNNDLGEEHERIWQQFFQRHLGPEFSVLRGGHILDHVGYRSEAQFDLLIVSAGATVVVPGDSDGGKANVFIDELIAAVMVTTNLTEAKLRSDWGKLQTIPEFAEKEKDFPALKGHVWPLCYQFASQSCTIERICETWKQLVKEGFTKVVPQIVLSLDGGAARAGSMCWPRPRYPNGKDHDPVETWTGIDSGMGLAWALLQMKGRLRAIEKKALGPIVRYGKVLDKALLKPAVPPTWSTRFDTMFQQQDLAGIFVWGSTACFAHNRLQLRSLRRNIPGRDRIVDVELFQSGIDLENLEWNTRSDFLRWFRYGICETFDDFVALEEWEHARSQVDHRRRIAVFRASTGVEIVGDDIDALQSVQDLSKWVSLEDQSNR